MKKREFSIYVLAIILVYLVNIFMFFINVNNASYPFKKDINCYSFWEYSTHNGILTVFMFLLPIIISLITIKNINTKIYGSYLRNYLIRDDYKKLIKKEYLSCLVKTITPYVIISILIFIFGFIFLKHDISRHLARFSMSWILMPKVIGKSGFWCAGLMARPTKKLMSVAFSNSSRAMSEAPSRRVDQLAERSVPLRKSSAYLSTREMVTTPSVTRSTPSSWLMGGISGSG